MILHNFILALGHNGHLPPAVAAWAAHSLFRCGGGVILPYVCGDTAQAHEEFPMLGVTVMGIGN